MSVTCATCGYDNNPADAEFCDACGAELQTAAAATPAASEPQTSPLDSTPEIVSIAPPAPTSPPLNSEPEATVTSETPTPSSETTTSARLVAKQPNAPQPEFPLNSVALVGIFDSDSGPVDIDLETFFGGETVSRHHGEIYPDGDNWMVKDLGSTNGIFIKPSGQSRFGARITTPTALNSGDELAFGKVQFIFQSP
ncbi:FHA domain-containing protein [Baaleninema sp.]|uniref:FHA domain-containing protein n=1 Tax=Baaleninema sp. TaxID=3101197 RepID=UPI003CFFEF63